MIADLTNQDVVLGVGGGISAYRSLELIRLLKKLGANVCVMPTRNALQFVGELSFEALSGQKCLSNPLSLSLGQISHIEESAKARVLIVAPATCDLMAKMAHGMADELILQTILSYRGPCVIAPAMETQMWEHDATQRNVAILKERGYIFVGPRAGSLASGREGVGRMAEPKEILEAVLCARTPKDFANRRVLVTAGPTVEDIDPVRFISNRSSGKMGMAIARALALRGAKVDLVHGPMPTQISNLANIVAYPVRSAEQMFDKVIQMNAVCDIAILCAAVADFMPSTVHEEKIKKASGILEHLSLRRTPDILLALGQSRPRPFLVGFAAETGNLEEEAYRKCVDKNCDLICGNLVSGEENALDSDFNKMLIVDRNRNVTRLDKAPKNFIAHRILDIVGTRIAATQSRTNLGPAYTSPEYT